MNPDRILKTLDHHLERPTRLILYGRAAIVLGFPDAPAALAATLDVDAILPEVEMTAIEEDEQFWKAIEATNRELESEGLYLTHLFCDSQVILSDTWLERITGIHLDGLGNLKLFRPSTEDLILTKMMREDPQDREDILFLLGHLQMDPSLFLDFASNARIPPIPELHEAFTANLNWLKMRLGVEGH